MLLCTWMEEAETAEEQKKEQEEHFWMTLLLSLKHVLHH